MLHLPTYRKKPKKNKNKKIYYTFQHVEKICYTFQHIEKKTTCYTFQHREKKQNKAKNKKYMLHLPAYREKKNKIVKIVLYCLKQK